MLQQIFRNTNCFFFFLLILIKNVTNLIYFEKKQKREDLNRADHFGALPAQPQQSGDDHTEDEGLGEAPVVDQRPDVAHTEHRHREDAHHHQRRDRGQRALADHRHALRQQTISLHITQMYLNAKKL